MVSRERRYYERERMVGEREPSVEVVLYERTLLCIAERVAVL